MVLSDLVKLENRHLDKVALGSEAHLKDFHSRKKNELDFILGKIPFISQ